MALMSAVCVPLLSLPYCKSESQLMSEQIIYMQSNGIDLVFNNQYVELPNLFSVIFSQITQYISNNITIIHAISLVFSLLCVWVAYKFGKFFFSVQAGVMSAAIMTVQNVFLAQSGLCLPQMMLNACILGCMYMFFREKYGWCTLLGTLASLIDISGIACAVFVIVSYLKIKYKEWSMSKNLMLTIPIACWFVYESFSLILCGKLSMRTPDFDLRNFAENLYFIFADQYRFVISAILIVVIISNMISKNIQYFVREMAKHGVCLLILLYLINSALGNTPSWNLTAISLLAILTGCAISSLPISYYSKYMMACAIIAASSASLVFSHESNDAYVNYKSAVKVDKKTVELIEKHVEDNASIICDAHMRRIMSYYNLGYKNTYQKLTIIKQDNDSTAASGNWAILNTADTSAAAIAIRQNGDFHKMTSIYTNGYQNEIFRKK